MAGFFCGMPFSYLDRYVDLGTGLLFHTPVPPHHDDRGDLAPAASASAASAARASAATSAADSFPVAEENHVRPNRLWVRAAS